jgi:hypothetical protein
MGKKGDTVNVKPGKGRRDGTTALSIQMAGQLLLMLLP